MKYSYKIEGNGVDSTYAKICLDRNVSNRYFSFGSRILNTEATPAQINLMKAINKTPGVVRSVESEHNLCGLIVLQGNSVQVQIIGQVDIAETVNQIVKKIQRRVAKGEARKRIKVSDIAVTINRLNGIN